MQRALLIVALAVNMLSLFLVSLALVLKLPVLSIIGLFVIMLNIFLSVLALVIRPEEGFSQFTERALAGTPLARHVAPAVNFPPARR
ncbi:ORFX protein [Blackcurrant waikavirus A]|uniref:ORFX protein n=1 Tax=Blackcurrant waikavirus A TaxID=1569061 RepID=A0AAE7IJ03_9SECO|nr:ORFX protein [Blackcurrant waikavirus A]QMU95532.1 ORFX protein [Blackcurrant waikavirus A]